MSVPWPSQGDVTEAELTAALALKQSTSEKGEASGYAALDADGRVLDGSGDPVESTDGDIIVSDTRPAEPTVGLVRIGAAYVAPPAAPTGLAVTPSNTQNALAWTLPAGTLTNVKVYRSTTSGSGFSVIATLSGSAVAYSDTGLTNGTTYYYKVSASTSGGEGDLSTQASGTPAISTVTLATDTFNRVSNYGTDTNGLGTSSGGQTWVKDVGVLAISSNEARYWSGGAASTTIDCAEDDVTVQATIKGTPTASSHFLLFRGASGFGSVWRAGWDAGGNFRICKNTGGANSSAVDVPGTPVAGDVYTLTVSGSTAVLKVNGVTKVTHNAVDNVGSTKHGLHAQDGNYRWDDFSVTTP